MDIHYKKPLRIVLRLFKLFCQTCFLIRWHVPYGKTIFCAAKVSFIGFMYHPSHMEVTLGGLQTLKPEILKYITIITVIIVILKH